MSDNIFSTLILITPVYSQMIKRENSASVTVTYIDVTIIMNNHFKSNGLIRLF